MKVQTRMGRGRRIWVCPVCGWRETISTRKHFQTGQPLTREQQIASLAVAAERHFREKHLHAFSGRAIEKPVSDLRALPSMGAPSAE